MAKKQVVTTKLGPEDVEALKGLATAFGSMSAAIRSLLLPEGKLLVSVAFPGKELLLEALRLDAELQRIEGQAKSEVYREVGGRVLAQLGDEGIEALRKELRDLERQAVDPNNFARDEARRKAEDLRARLATLEELRAKALVVAEERAKEKKRAADIDPLVEIKGGALLDALTRFVEAQRQYEIAAARYRYVPERSEEILGAKQALDEARADLESLLSRYKEALEIRRKRAEEREAARQAEQEKARESIRPQAEELFAAFGKFVALLSDLWTRWGQDPLLQELVALANEVNARSEEFARTVRAAGEVDRYGRPSEAVRELLSILRKQVEEKIEPVNAPVRLLHWAANVKFSFRSDGLPVVEAPPSQ